MAVFWWLVSEIWRAPHKWEQGCDSQHIAHLVCLSQQLPISSSSFFLFLILFLRNASKWPMQKKSFFKIFSPPLNFSRSERGMLELKQNSLDTWTWMNGRGLLLLLSLSRLRVFTWREAVESTEWQTKPDDRLIGKMFRRIERENSHIAPAAAASASRHSTRLRMFALSVCRMLHRTSDDVNEIRLISIVRRHRRRQVMRNALKSPFDFVLFLSMDAIRNWWT